MPGEIEQKTSKAGLTYGFIVYWGTIIGSIIAIIGTVVAFVTHHNMANHSYWIVSIWEGKSTREIWDGIIDAPTVGHWYLQNLSYGDSLSAFGISAAVFCVTLAMAVTAFILFKNKAFVFGTLAILAAFVTILPLLGFWPAP